MGRGRRTEGELQRWRALRDSNLRRLAGVSAARARSRDPEPQRGIWDMARPKRFELPTFWFVVSSGRFGLSGAQLQTLGNSESVPRFSQLPATPSKQVVATLSATVASCRSSLSGLCLRLRQRVLRAHQANRSRCWHGLRHWLRLSTGPYRQGEQKARRSMSLWP